MSQASDRNGNATSVALSVALAQLSFGFGAASGMAAGFAGVRRRRVLGFSAAVAVVGAFGLAAFAAGFLTGAFRGAGFFAGAGALTGSAAAGTALVVVFAVAGAAAALVLRGVFAFGAAGAGTSFTGAATSFTGASTTAAAFGLRRRVAGFFGASTAPPSTVRSTGLLAGLALGAGFVATFTLGILPGFAVTSA